MTHLAVVMKRHQISKLMRINHLMIQTLRNPMHHLDVWSLRMLSLLIQNWKIIRLIQRRVGINLVRKHLMILNQLKERTSVKRRPRKRRAIIVVAQLIKKSSRLNLIKFKNCFLRLFFFYIIVCFLN